MDDIPKSEHLGSLTGNKITLERVAESRLFAIVAFLELVAKSAKQSGRLYLDRLKEMDDLPNDVSQRFKAVIETRTIQQLSLMNIDPKIAPEDVSEAISTQMETSNLIHPEISFAQAHHELSKAENPEYNAYTQLWEELQTLDQSTYDNKLKLNAIIRLLRLWQCAKIEAKLESPDATFDQAPFDVMVCLLYASSMDYIDLSDDPNHTS